VQLLPNFDKHLRTTHPFEADELLGNQFLLLERDQEIPNYTHDRLEGIHHSYSDAYDDSNSSESNSINYYDQDPDNNSDLESESYFMMEESDGDANRHEAATMIYEGAGECLYCSEDYNECSQIFSDTRGTHSTQHTSLKWHVISYCRRPQKEISIFLSTLSVRQW
jgi:hypothetical protein